MLHDAPIRKVDGDLPRKWMMDRDLELILWYQTEGGIAGFELIHSDNIRRHSLRWLPAQGFQYACIDEGEQSPEANRTPILCSGPAFPKAQVLALFSERSATLPPEIRDFVLEKLTRY